MVGPGLVKEGSHDPNVGTRYFTLDLYDHIHSRLTQDKNINGLEVSSIETIIFATTKSTRSPWLCLKH